jgi:hypothetical protein
LMPASVMVSARATELSASMAMAAAVVSKAFLNIVPLSPRQEIFEVPFARRGRQGPEQKSGFEFRELSSRPTLSGLYPLSCLKKMSNTEVFPENEVAARLM